MDRDQKSGTILAEAFLDIIRLAVREEIRMTLKEGGFSFDDRLVDVKEASKILCVAEDWLHRHARQLPFTRRLG